jgi:hypothetical protein
LRLGSLLGKTIGEVRALPVSEYRKWQLFYILEPWGYHNTEFLFGKLLAVLYTLASHDKTNYTAKQFMRDNTKIATEPDMSEMTTEERHEYIIMRAKEAFGVA